MSRLDRILQVTSLMTIALMSLHGADDVMRGFEPVGLKNLYGIAIIVLWLWATLLLIGTRTGYGLLFLGSALATVIPVAHFSGAGVAAVVGTQGGLLFIWTLIALGALGGISLILTLRGAWTLWQSPRDAPRASS